MKTPLNFQREVKLRVKPSRWYNVHVKELLFKMGIAKKPYALKMVWVSGGNMFAGEMSTDKLFNTPVSSVLFLNLPRGYIVEVTKGEQ